MTEETSLAASNRTSPAVSRMRESHFSVGVYKGRVGDKGDNVGDATQGDARRERIEKPDEWPPPNSPDRHAPVAITPLVPGHQEHVRDAAQPAAGVKQSEVLSQHDHDPRVTYAAEPQHADEERKNLEDWVPPQP